MSRGADMAYSSSRDEHLRLGCNRSASIGPPKGESAFARIMDELRVGTALWVIAEQHDCERKQISMIAEAIRREQFDDALTISRDIEARCVKRADWPDA